MQLCLLAFVCICGLTRSCFKRIGLFDGHNCKTDTISYWNWCYGQNCFHGTFGTPLRIFISISIIHHLQNVSAFSLDASLTAEYTGVSSWIPKVTPASLIYTPISETAGIPKLFIPEFPPPPGESPTWKIIPCYFQIVRKKQKIQVLFNSLTGINWCKLLGGLHSMQGTTMSAWFWICSAN